MRTHLLLLLAGTLGTANLVQQAHAQVLDPSFARQTLYSPGTVYSALEQTDGKKVVTGSFTHINGTPSSLLTRFNVNGTIDAAFQQNVGTTSAVYRVAQLSNGQLLLTSFTASTFTAGGITRNSLIRLNNDGTPDAGFNTGAGTNTALAGSSVDFALPLPNGQVLATGGFNSFNGVAVNNIVRLNASGAVDATFNAGGTGADDYIGTSTLLPTGKILIAGYFANYNGTPRNGLARLNADGTLDATFAPNLPAQANIDNFVVQPDGRILVAGYVSTTSGLARLLADGSADNSFNAPANYSGGSVYSYYGNGLEVQSDGKILVAFHDGTTALPVARLNSNGTADPTFAPAFPGFIFYSMTLLASGKLLVAGRSALTNTSANNTLLQLNTNGSLDTSFLPLFQTTGAITNVVRQSDGKLIASGGFSEINGQAVSLLARFNTDGTLDGTYGGSAAVAGSVNDLSLQPDGKLLVMNSAYVQRLLPTGGIDNTFSSFQPNQVLIRLALQPDGRILVASQSNSNSSIPAIARLLANGSPDASFTAAGGAGIARMSNVRALVLQPDGRVLVAGTYTPATGSAFSTVRRLETNGTFDATFTPSAFLQNGVAATLNSLALQADGKLLVAGAFTTVGGLASSNLTRLSTTGTVDSGFTPPAFTSGSVTKVLLQPNGRILLGGLFASSSLPGNLARLLPTGAADASYAATAVPNSTVRALLVQPDGGIMAGGTFTTINGQPAGGIARITALNVLAVQAPAAVAARTEAWPVPAHEQLNVQTDASAHAQSLDLLDVLGRPVRHIELRTGITTTSLRCEGLPAGTYLLRVSYAEGVVARRVQVQ